MLASVIQHTPRWVFVLFLALLSLGLSQMFPRQVSLRRVSFMALAMAGLALWSVLGAFAAQPLAWLGWTILTMATSTAIGRQPAPQGATFHRDTQRFTVPGSPWPLVLMMGTFATKYAVGASLAMHPTLADDLAFATACGAVYGLYSGVFLGRAWRLWHLALQTTTPAGPLANA